MDQIQHKFVDVGGHKLHVADVGTGPNVFVFLNGFLEIWYSWRHQMIALAGAGFRAFAPDYGGYGLSDLPPEPAKPPSLSSPMTCSECSMQLFHKYLPEGFYISRWKEPGRAEADFGRFDTKTVLKNIYILFSRSEIPIAEENQEIMDLVDPSTPVTPWFTEEDLAAYVAFYDKSGFPNALKVPYRSLREDYNIADPIAKVAAFLIMGGKNYFLKFPGIEDQIKSGKVKELAPHLEITSIPEGSHFVQEQFPEQVNQLILDFLGKQVIKLK